MSKVGLFSPSGYIENKRKAAWQRVEEWQGFLYSGVVFGATLVMMFWASVFLYTSFYFTYMPQESVTWPIHFQYNSCGERPGICSNPQAIIGVTDPIRGSILARGQKYRVVVDIEMPESPMNQRLGMFLVEMSMKSHDGEVLRKSSRSTMLRYRSPLLNTIATTLFAPFLLYGINEEKQMVTTELFSQYEEDPVIPLSEVHVQLVTRHVELYGAQLRIHAMFTGLRYFMYHYPLTAAGVGVGICMVFLSAVVILSWYQFSGSGTDLQMTRKPINFPNGQANTGSSTDASTNNLLAPKPIVSRSRSSSIRKVEEKGKSIDDTDTDDTVTHESRKSDDANQLPEAERRDSDEFEVVSPSKLEVDEKGRRSRRSSNTNDDENDESVLRRRVQSIHAEETVMDE